MAEFEFRSSDHFFLSGEFGYELCEYLVDVLLGHHLLSRVCGVRCSVTVFLCRVKWFMLIVYARVSCVVTVAIMT